MEKIAMQKERIKKIEEDRTKDQCRTHNTSKKLFYKSKRSNQNVRSGLIARKSCFEWSNKLKQLVSARIKVLEESISREAIQNMQDVSNEKINTIHQPSKENRSNKARPKNQTTKFKYMEDSHNVSDLANQARINFVLIPSLTDTEETDDEDIDGNLNHKKTHATQVNQSGLANQARISNVLRPSLTDTEEIDEEDMKEIFDEKKNCTGLCAGTPGSLEHHAPNQINELRLINRGSDCFVSYNFLEKQHIEILLLNTCKHLPMHLMRTLSYQSLCYKFIAMTFSQD